MSTNTSKIVGGLRALADELKPFMDEVLEGSRVWNETAYVAAVPSSADKYALAWWSTLTSIADMLERQGGALTDQQFVYMKQLLYGGMGSFNDFSLSTKIHGSAADIANKKLDKKRTELYSLLR